MFDLKEHTQIFAEKMSETLKSTFGIESVHSGNVEILEQIPNESGLYVNLMMTGTLYGEYILAIEETTAKRILESSGMNDTDDELLTSGQIFGELLNIVAGMLAPKIKGPTDEITITSPRIFVGKPYYPPIKSARSRLILGDNIYIDCLFYVDKMALDITDSYKESIRRLLLSYKKLKDSHEKILTQQKLLVHAEKVTSLGTLSAGVAHNINNPLGIISLTASKIKRIIDEEDVNKGKAQNSVTLIKQTVQRIANIITSLRSYSQDITITSISSCSAKPFFDAVLSEFINGLEDTDKQIEFSLNYKNITNVQFECGPNELKKSLFNLLQNAVEAVKESSNEQKKWIKIDVNSTKDHLIISLSNSGNKIDPSDVTKIFDPFFTTKDPSHPGLGLTLARGVIEGHGGELSLDADKEYTCIHLTLPLRFKDVEHK
ncbi:MAG: GHKL domain-containing protein [Bdellovibrionales bacterium]|nr:GHKL domain-containing protein [Bdellovibrionales bacterium]